MAPRGEHGLPVEGGFTFWILTAAHTVGIDRLDDEQEDLHPAAARVIGSPGSRTSACPETRPETTLSRPPADSIARAARRARCGRREPFTEPLRVEPRAVVLDDQQHLVPRRPKRDADRFALPRAGRRS